MMWNDPIVEETRRHREAYSASFDHDLAAICRDLRERQERRGDQVVSLPPRRVAKPVPSDSHPVAFQGTSPDGEVQAG